MPNKEEHIRYCSHCHRIEFSDADACPACKEKLSEKTLGKEEIKIYSREAYNRSIAAYDKQQNAGCFLVIGGIIFIIGILFIFLSLQKKMNKIVGINVASFQFVVCIVCLALGLALISWGTFALVRASKRRRAAKREIDYLTVLDSAK